MWQQQVQMRFMIKLGENKCVMYFLFFSSGTLIIPSTFQTAADHGVQIYLCSQWLCMDARRV